MKISSKHNILKKMKQKVNQASDFCMLFQQLSLIFIYIYIYVCIISPPTIFYHSDPLTLLLSLTLKPLGLLISYDLGTWCFILQPFKFLHDPPIR